MRLTFLGTGASHGIPVIGCGCLVCKSNNIKDKRLRSSILLETNLQNLVIDVGPDFRQQMLRSGTTRVDAALLTHEHKDHTAGLDDVRAFNYLMKKPMSIYAENRVLESIKREYSYVFADARYPGAPEFDLNDINEKPFEINGDKIMPIRAYHNQLPVLGFRIGDMAYLTDLKTISEEEKLKLTNLKVLVLSALREKEHVSHLGLNEALKLIEECQPEQAYLTHMSHMQLSYSELLKILPANVQPAFDGLIVEC